MAQPTLSLTGPVPNFDCSPLGQTSDHLVFCFAFFRLARYVSSLDVRYAVYCTDLWETRERLYCSVQFFLRCVQMQNSGITLLSSVFLLSVTALSTSVYRKGGGSAHTPQDRCNSVLFCLLC